MSQEPSRHNFGQTRWSLILEGKRPDEAGDQARNRLLERYHCAINRYLLSRLGDPHAVDEVYEIYVDRVKENHAFLQRADREKGRFRHYLRRVLQNLVIDYHRKKKNDAKPIDEDIAGKSEVDLGDEDFRREWVNELMFHAWRALEAESRAKDKPYYDVMLFKAENPQARSREIAAHFSAAREKPMSEANVRQILHRGQEMLSDFFIRETANSLEKQMDSLANADQVEAELIELRMLDDPRRAALARYRAETASRTGE